MASGGRGLGQDVQSVRLNGQIFLPHTRDLENEGRCLGSHDGNQQVSPAQSPQSSAAPWPRPTHGCGKGWRQQGPGGSGACVGKECWSGEIRR